ncbi:MAG: xanthine dehydrogenase family protein molybdopterin-binding subunit [Sulfolobaceae archaeon]|nr:xanthine dehydrogenase family protein molybdopterin-binding subunit [Sulfolobaceae archaeon]
MLRDHLPKILGKAKYVDDITLPNMAYMYVVRSIVARGRIVDMSLPSKALLTLTWKDVNVYMNARADPETLKTSNIVRMPVLANEYVNFVGQPVMAIVVEDRYETEDVADGVGVDYERLKPVLTIDDALNSEPIHPGIKSNVSVNKLLEGGDLSAKSKADVVVERELMQNRIVPNPMEPKGVIAYWDGDKLNLIGSFQSVFRVRDDFREILGLPPEKLRITSATVGGGFGSKVSSQPEYILAALASMKLKRPVKWIETRREHLVATHMGRGVKSRVRLYGTRNGEILGIEGNIWVDFGAYNFQLNPSTPGFIASLLTGPYRMKFASIRAQGVFTNLTPTSAYRGAGRPEAALILESVVEDFAEKIGMDPVEVRERNLVPDSGFITPLKLKYDPAGYSQVLKRAKEVYKIAKEEFKGKGVSLVMVAEHVRLSPGEGARVKVEDGKVKVYVGTGPHGQAYEETYSRIASQVLNIPQDKIEVYTSSTDYVKEGIGSFGSRGGTIGGSAVMLACQELKKRVGSDGDLLTKAEGIEVEVFYRAEDVFSPSAAVAVVDVDEEIGMPKVLKYYQIDDVGRVLVREEVEGQIIGGALQGASQVLWERTMFDEEGNPLFFSIADCGVPDAIQSFRVEVEELENPSPALTGSRGVGEVGTTAALASVFLALEKRVGKKFNKTPVDPEELIKLV